MNPYCQNLNRMEFLITLACTGQCKHCSEGTHTAAGESINGDAAAKAVDAVCERFPIQSVMTFGGEPLLYWQEVCKIHTAARNRKIPKRQLITNGFFSKNQKMIRQAVTMLAQSGVNDILLSVDAFHQETIPLKPVMDFAKAVKGEGIPIRTHPAWLVHQNGENPYNKKTREILKQFECLDIAPSDGNMIIPAGNADKYLKEYFDFNQPYDSPYTENPMDIHSICISPGGDVLDDNIYKTDILSILEHYQPVL